MNLVQLEPRKAQNKAFLKIDPNRVSIYLFKLNLISLLDAINEKETEEFQKNLVIDFLKKTYYDSHYFVNSLVSNNLAIHNRKDGKPHIGVVVKIKRPSSEMISKANLNVKGLQELVLLYLRERITHKNTNFKHLVVTTIYEWFVFDAQQFNTLFVENIKLVNDFITFENECTSDEKTEFFCKKIAKPFIDKIQHPINFYRFDLCSYEKTLQNIDTHENKHLMALFKFLSPQYLPQLSFANESTSFEKKFYPELLHHPIGFTGTQESGKPNIPNCGLRSARANKKHRIFLNLKYRLNE